VHEALAAKATPEETEAFGRWMVTAAQAAADAAKEGGFMGSTLSGSVSASSRCSTRSATPSRPNAAVRT
jgi:hypothetical protein